MILGFALFLTAFVSLTPRVMVDLALMAQAAAP